MNDAILFNGQFFICPFCEKGFKSLVYHTTQKHKINKIQLRKMFNLPLNYPLEIRDTIINRRNKALFYEMDKQLIKAEINTRFIKNQKLSKTIINNISRGHILKDRKITIL